MASGQRSKGNRTCRAFEPLSKRASILCCKVCRLALTSGLIADLSSLLRAIRTLKPEGKPGASSQSAPGKTVAARGNPQGRAIGESKEGGKERTQSRTVVNPGCKGPGREGSEVLGFGTRE